MNAKVFSEDFKTDKELIVLAGSPIENVRMTIKSDDASEEVIAKGSAFSDEIEAGFVSDFEKPGDKMAHVSTFIVKDGIVYMTYYANTKEPSEDPKNQTARLVWAPIDNIEEKTYIDLQTTGDTVGGKTIDMVYDTILMQKDEDTVYIMWTARTVEENYYRFYCPFTLSTKTLGQIGVNRFKVGDIVNDFSASGIRSALAENGVPYKKTYSDIGIMQKLSSRICEGDNSLGNKEILIASIEVIFLKLAHLIGSVAALAVQRAKAENRQLLISPNVCVIHHHFTPFSLARSSAVRYPPLP